MAIIFVVHPQGVLPFAVYLAVTAAAYRVFTGTLSFEAIGLYTAYAALVLLIYFVQKAEFPMYFGLSGPEGSYGTDDTYYFSQVADRVRYDMDLREYYQYDIHEYSTFLKTVAVVEVRHLFDIIWVNLIGAVMLPVFTRGLAMEMFEEKNVGQVAFILMAICPFTLANSLILMRDGWSATLFVGASLLFFRRQPARLLLLGGLLFYLRVASALQLLAALGLYSLVWVKEARTRLARRAIIGSQAVAGVVGVIGVFFVLSQFRGIENIYDIGSLLFRSDFLEFFQKYRSDSFLLQLYQLPVFIRLPATFIFFLLFPFVEVSEIFYGNVFVIRGLLMCLYSVLFIVYFGFLIRGAIYALRNRSNVRFLITLAVFLFLMLVVSQVSMQIRHKIMILPLMYIIVAVGAVKANRDTWYVGALASGMVLLATFLKYVVSV
jgi:hypothetical protein